LDRGGGGCRSALGREGFAAGPLRFAGKPAPTRSLPVWIEPAVAVGAPLGAKGLSWRNGRAGRYNAPPVMTVRMSGFSSMAQQLEVGAVGWRHAGWADSFYPDSLPPEWQLTYYGNEFARVLVPAAEWSEADPEDFATWCGDVHERFGFYLELPGVADAPMRRTLAQAVEALGPCLSGLVVRVGGEAPVLAVDGLRQEFGVDMALFVDIPSPPDPLWLEAAQGAGAAVCWRPEHGEWLQGSGMGLLRAAEAAVDRRALRGHIEAFLRQAESVDERTLLFEGTPPPVTAMQDAQIITSLLAGE